MATALGKVREQVVDAALNGGAWKGKARRLQQVLQRKVERLLTEDVAQRLGFRSWEADVDTFVNHHLDQHDIDFLFMPTADLRFFAAQRSRRTSHTIVFGAGDGDGVECYRDETTLLINRTGQPGATRSWSRRLSITKAAGPNAYPRHLYEQNYEGRVAKYGAGLIPRDLETLAVKRGFGHFSGERIFFYARFNAPTGTVRVGARRVETPYLKVQLDRVARPAFGRALKNGRKQEHRDGWEVHMHGYPIAEAELWDDFETGAGHVDGLALATP